ncbi:PEP-CTERM sorting domain-containing protein [Leptolyngbya sp. FACHB-36]|uniref:PEP-CTERM sorting domain-containing protein n=1 Tax=Leptolyngbya sp. FACHB-36 TaxID=2692808 RepID=UPI001680F874|nr:PEP-CTERM sorting domain-containing protein [Leptolyngbya sp. FACHB-36]MBD2022590.1 PEP-CTERM sorting domain-containing protein [Leptolyngbya sp. FACHB-36]
MKSKLSTVLPLAALATVSMALVTSVPAHAFTIGCPSSIADNVTGTSGCQYSDSANQDSVSPNRPLTVNQEGFFGITNWSFGGKIGTNSGYAGTQSGQSGSWNLASVFQSSWTDVMLIFKSGNGTTLVGYELKDGVKAGNWTSPFESSLFGGNNTKDVSHISVYYREGGNSAAVPEPATILGTMAAGSLLLGRKKLQRKAQ